jgi:hypothetical protein
MIDLTSTMMSNLGDFRQIIYPSRLSVCPAAALSLQLHSVAMRLSLLGWSSDTPLPLTKHPAPYGKIILGKRPRV